MLTQILRSEALAVYTAVISNINLAQPAHIQCLKANCHTCLFYRYKNQNENISGDKHQAPYISVISQPGINYFLFFMLKLTVHFSSGLDRLDDVTPPGFSNMSRAMQVVLGSNV